MRRILTPAILFFFTLTLSAQSLPDIFFFDQISVPGTIQSAITEDIMQDPYGMLWIAKDALYRYNGRDFQKYDMVLPDSGLFSAREITRLRWDNTGNRLLIGTRNYGIVEYDYKTDKLRKLPARDGVPIIGDISVIDGEIWAASFPSGLFKVVNDTLVRVPSFSQFKNPTRMVTAGKDLWIGFVHDVIVVRNNVIRKHVSLSRFNEYYPNGMRSSTLMLDHLGRLWIGTEREGIVVLDTATLNPVRKFSPREDPFYNPITCIVQDKDNTIWIGTRGGGLVVYSPETDTYKTISRSSTDDGSLSADNVTSACVDATGIVWIGGAGDLNKYDKAKIKFQHFFHDAKNPNSLSDDNIRNVFEDEDGIIYLATSGGYLNSIDRKKNIIKNYRPKAEDAKGLIMPFSIASLNADILLVGCSDGVLQFDKRTGQFNPFEPLAAVTRGGPVRQIMKHGKEYIVLARGKVVSYSPDTKRIAVYGTQQKIYGAGSLAFDNQDRLWIGTHDGVVYTDKQRKNFELLKLEHDRARPDSSFFLALSLQAVGNDMWVNSFNNAIYVVNLASDPPRVTERINNLNGLPDNTVYASIPDDHGNVWITHNGGISRYNMRSKQFINFTVSEGLQDEEFNRLAFCKSSSGEIMFGGINGLNVFDPASIKLPELNLSVRVQDVTSFRARKPTMEGVSHSVIQGNQQLHLSYDNNSVQFAYFVPDYHDPIRYRVRYRLEPFEASWKETDKLMSGTYFNLNPGTYTFTVRVTDPTGLEAVDSVSIIITPPFWRTWWFVVVTGMVCSLFVYYVIQSSIRAAHREKIKLEELLKVRTREIEQSREELENLNRKKDLIFSILSHDLRSPLTTLKGFLGLLIDQAESISRTDLQRYASNIRNSVTTSLDLIDNTLFWSLSQTGNIQCNPTPVQLAPVFEKIKGLYQLTAEKKHLTLNFPSTNGLAVFADENMVYVLLRNLVSNAIKFTPEMNAIRVDVSDYGEDVMVSVKDSGVGMTPEEISQIFLFDNPMVKKGTSSEKGTGLGLILCKKFVEMNKGKLLIESKVGVGSAFTVVLPKSVSSPEPAE